MLAHFFLHADRSKHLINISLGVGKTGPAHSFPTLIGLNIILMHKVVTWGKTVVHMVNWVGKNSASL